MHGIRIQVPELVRYFEEAGHDYLFVSMARHECFFHHSEHHDYDTRLDMLLRGT